MTSIFDNKHPNRTEIRLCPLDGARKAQSQQSKVDFKLARRNLFWKKTLLQIHPKCVSRFPTVTTFHVQTFSSPTTSLDRVKGTSLDRVKGSLQNAESLRKNLSSWKGHQKRWV